MPDVPLTVVSPVVSSIWAASAPNEPDITWTIGYAPETEPDGDLRVIFGTLDASGETGGGSVRVSCFVTGTGSDSVEDVEAALSGDLALETVYDVARVALRTVLATVDADAVIPTKAPAPTLEQLVRADSQDSEHL
jgi:hypothetical protein